MGNNLTYKFRKPSGSILFFTINLKMKKIILYFFTLIHIGWSCHSRNEYDASIVAKDYCACLRAKNPSNNPEDYFYAKKICDGRMMEKYYFFRCMEITVGLEQSRSFNDSLFHFGRDFDEAVKKNCCQFVGRCK